MTENKRPFRVELTNDMHTYELYNAEGKEIFDLEKAKDEADRQYPNFWVSVFNGEVALYRQ